MVSRDKKKFSSPRRPHERPQTLRRRRQNRHRARIVAVAHRLARRVCEDLPPTAPRRAGRMRLRRRRRRLERGDALRRAIFFACFAIFFMSGAITRCTFALSASAFSASEPSSAEEASSLSDMAGLETNKNCATLR